MLPLGATGGRPSTCPAAVAPLLRPLNFCSSVVLPFLWAWKTLSPCGSVQHGDHQRDALQLNIIPLHLGRGDYEGIGPSRNYPGQHEEVK
jgi:hypothetical protein